MPRIPRLGNSPSPAAGDLQFALDPVTGSFRRTHPEIVVTATYGSSGNFYSEIRNQAPFDVFLSADGEDPRKLGFRSNLRSMSHV